MKWVNKGPIDQAELSRLFVAAKRIVQARVPTEHIQLMQHYFYYMASLEDRQDSSAILQNHYYMAGVVVTSLLPYGDIRHGDNAIAKELGEFE